MNVCFYVYGSRLNGSDLRLITKTTIYVCDLKIMWARGCGLHLCSIFRFTIFDWSQNVRLNFRKHLCCGVTIHWFVCLRVGRYVCVHFGRYLCWYIVYGWWRFIAPWLSLRGTCDGWCCLWVYMFDVTYLMLHVIRLMMMHIWCYMFAWWNIFFERQNKETIYILYVICSPSCFHFKE